MIQVSIVKYYGALEVSSARSECDRELLTFREYKIEGDAAAVSIIVRTWEPEDRRYLSTTLA